MRSRINSLVDSSIQKKNDSDQPIPTINKEKEDMTSWTALWGRPPSPSPVLSPSLASGVRKDSLGVNDPRQNGSFRLGVLPSPVWDLDNESLSDKKRRKNSTGTVLAAVTDLDDRNKDQEQDIHRMVGEDFADMVAKELGMNDVASREEKEEISLGKSLDNTTKKDIIQDATNDSEIAHDATQVQPVETDHKHADEQLYDTPMMTSDEFSGLIAPAMKNSIAQNDFDVKDDTMERKFLDADVNPKTLGVALTDNITPLKEDAEMNDLLQLQTNLMTPVHRAIFVDNQYSTDSPTIPLHIANSIGTQIVHNKARNTLSASKSIRDEFNKEEKQIQLLATPIRDDVTAQPQVRQLELSEATEVIGDIESQPSPPISATKDNNDAQVSVQNFVKSTVDENVSAIDQEDMARLTKINQPTASTQKNLKQIKRKSTLLRAFNRSSQSREDDPQILTVNTSPVDLNDTSKQPSSRNKLQKKARRSSVPSPASAELEEWPQSSPLKRQTIFGTVFGRVRSEAVDNAVKRNRLSKVIPAEVIEQQNNAVITDIRIPSTGGIQSQNVDRQPTLPNIQPNATEIEIDPINRKSLSSSVAPSVRTGEGPSRPRTPLSYRGPNIGYDADAVAPPPIPPNFLPYDRSASQTPSHSNRTTSYRLPSTAPEIDYTPQSSNFGNDNPYDTRVDPPLRSRTPMGSYRTPTPYDPDPILFGTVSRGVTVSSRRPSGSDIPRTRSLTPQPGPRQNSDTPIPPIPSFDIDLINFRSKSTPPISYHKASKSQGDIPRPKTAALPQLATNPADFVPIPVAIPNQTNKTSKSRRNSELFIPAFSMSSKSTRQARTLRRHSDHVTSSPTSPINIAFSPKHDISRVPPVPVITGRSSVPPPSSNGMTTREERKLSGQTYKTAAGSKRPDDLFLPAATYDQQMRIFQQQSQQRYQRQVEQQYQQQNQQQFQPQPQQQFQQQPQLQPQQDYQQNYQQQVNQQQYQRQDQPINRPAVSLVDQNRTKYTIKSSEKSRRFSFEAVTPLTPAKPHF